MLNRYCALNVKALADTFNQEKALVGAFSVITNLRVDLRFKLYLTPAQLQRNRPASV